MLNHYLNQCWIDVNWNFRNKFQLDSTQNMQRQSIGKHGIENVEKNISVFFFQEDDF